MSYTSNGYGYAGQAALGQAVGIVTTSAQNGGAQATTTTTNSYQWREAAQLASSVSSGPASSSTTYSYGANGRLDSVGIQDGRPRTVSFVNDLNGQALTRDEDHGNPGQGDPHDRYYRFAGVEIGHSGNNSAAMPDYATSIDLRSRAGGTAPFSTQDTRYDERFARTIDKLTSYTPSGSAGSYTVRPGDTLATIAATLWGDASLWYKLASANGLSADTALTPGATLTVPAGTVRSTYNAGTFTPYDPADTLGDVSPLSPQAQAAKKKGNKCGVFGQILLVAVAVAVVALSHGTLSGFASSALGLGSTGGAIVGGALAGVAGSIASQGVGLATGIQDKFSFKGVALAALGGAAGGALKGVDLLGKSAGTFANNVASGALASAATQGVAVATGLQSKFDFAGVAAAGIGAGVAGFTGAKLAGLGKVGAVTLANTAGAIADAASRTLVNGTDFGDNLLAALPAAIGNTIGSLTADALHSDRGSRSAGAASIPRPVLVGGGLPVLALGASGVLITHDEPAPTSVEQARQMRAADIAKAKTLGATPANLQEIEATYRPYLDPAHYAAPVATIARQAPDAAYSPSRELVAIARTSGGAVVNLAGQAVGGIADLVIGTYQLAGVFADAMYAGSSRSSYERTAGRITTAWSAARDMRLGDVPRLLLSPAIYTIDQAFTHDNLRPAFSLLAGGAIGGALAPGATFGARAFAAERAGTSALEARGGTYLLRDPETGVVVRTGRTKDLARRQAEHARDAVLGQYDFEDVFRTDNYAEQRGLEQYLHDQYKPSLNKINPISSRNRKLNTYQDAAQRYLLEHGAP